MQTLTIYQFNEMYAFAVIVLAAFSWLALRSLPLVGVTLWCVGTILGAVSMLVSISIREYDANHIFTLRSLACVLTIVSFTLKTHGLSDLVSAAKMSASKTPFPKSANVVSALYAFVAVVIIYTVFLTSGNFQSYVLFAFCAASMLLCTFLAIQGARNFKNIGAYLVCTLLFFNSLGMASSVVVGVVFDADLLAPQAADAETPLIGFVYFALSIATFVFFNGVVIEAYEKKRRFLEAGLNRYSERLRILDELYQSTGSKLDAALLKAKTGKLSSEESALLLENSIADFHLILETIPSANGNLGDALYYLKNRSEQRLAKYHGRIHWDFRVDGLGRMSSSVVLDIMRIMQEFLNIAMGNSDSQNIWVRALIAKDGVLVLSVSNDAENSQHDVVAGEILEQLESRARRIWAKVVAKSTSHGLHLELTVAAAEING
jgi:hypothetical protein